MQSYNLIDQPWITCLMKDGSVREVGIHECLARAPDIAEITDPSPLIVVSLHRLLLAILHRNFGPEDHATWGELWGKGHWDTRVVDAYLEEWRDRFDLLHPDRPFYQTPDLPDKLLTSIAKLAHELASGNNAALFDHSLDHSPSALPLPAAARLLVTQQAYSIGGTYGSEGRGPVCAKSAPLLAGFVCLPRGANLAESLLLSMVRYERGTDFPILSEEGDAPAWESDEIRGPGEVPCRGYLEYLTWQSKRIRLAVHETSAGPEVAYIAITQGWELSVIDASLIRDPMMAWRRVSKPKPNEPPMRAMRITEERALWRDSRALTAPVTSDQFDRPRVLAELSQRVGRAPLEVDYPVRVDIAGLCSDKAKVNFWRHERFPLPLRYLTDADLAESLDLSLGAAEDAAQVIRAASWRLATVRLDPTGTRSPDRAEVDRLITGFPAQRLYWSRLEAPFHQFVLALPTDRDAALAQWRQTLRRTATRSFDEAAAGLEGSTDNLRATVAGRAALRSGLRKALAALDVSDHREETVTHGAI
jgi:CRISPR system Cascade subunit CasA